jgi:hypothetical protein
MDRCAAALLLLLCFTWFPPHVNADIDPKKVIENIEITQVIQTLQPLPALIASLDTPEGQPPVPIVADKPAVMRIYMKTVVTGTPYYIVATLPNGTEVKHAIYYLPKCASGAAWTPANQRNGTCPSFKFYFTPPKGNWSVTLTVYNLPPNAGTGMPLTLSFKGSQQQNNVTLRPVRVCEKQGALAEVCGDVSQLRNLIEIARKLYPTREVSVSSGFDVIKINSTILSDDDFWDKVLEDEKKIADKNGASASNIFAALMAPTGKFDDTGGIANLGEPEFAVRSMVVRLTKDTADEALAHEMGHTFGQKHTKTDLPFPVVAGMPPGCYNDPAGGDWPYDNNRLWSGPPNEIEYGFDLQTRAIKDGNSNYDIMSYCVPRWITALKYVPVQDVLKTRPAPVMPLNTNAYWEVSGTIAPGQAHLNPFFQILVEPAVTSDNGSYQIRVYAGNTVVYTRNFDPYTGATETEGQDIVTTPYFFEYIPIFTKATRIAVFDMYGKELGSAPVDFVPNTVTVTYPQDGDFLSGEQTVTWNVTSSDPSTIQPAQVFYQASPTDDFVFLGTAEAGQNFLQVDFDNVPAAIIGQAQIIVNAGKIRGQAIVNHLKTKNQPPMNPMIYSPMSNEVFFLSDLVMMSGSAYSSTGGTYSGQEISWSSSLDGVLGTGTSLIVGAGTGPSPTKFLRLGKHTLTMTATDIFKRTTTATRDITVVGVPAVEVTATQAENGPPGCLNITVNGAVDVNTTITGADYTLNSGKSFITIPVGSLPYTFQLPGQVTVNIVARIRDNVGQEGFSSDFVDSNCSFYR